MSNVRLGWIPRNTPPVITMQSATLNFTYDKLTLVYQTDEDTVGQVSYGVGNYDSTVLGDANGWSTNFNVTLANLVFGSTVQYRIAASDHHLDTNLAPKVGYYSGTFTVPLKPTNASTILGFGITNVMANRATLLWSTERTCTAQVSYHKAGSVAMERHFHEFVSDQTAILDLLEASTTYEAYVVVTDAFGFTNTQFITLNSGTNSTPDVIITVNTNQTHKISPYVYGINDYYNLKFAPRNLPFDRTGGNRWTAYNWENNASNAGNDYNYENDDYLGGGLIPAEAVRSRVATDRANDVASLIIVQLQGYVAADFAGPVDFSLSNRLATRFKQVN